MAIAAPVEDERKDPLPRGFQREGGRRGVLSRSCGRGRRELQGKKIQSKMHGMKHNIEVLECISAARIESSTRVDFLTP